MEALLMEIALIMSIRKRILWRNLVTEKEEKGSYNK